MSDSNLSATPAPFLTDFRTTPTPAHDNPRPDRLVRGNPNRTTWTHYSAAQGDFDCGIWTCEPGAWRIAFPAGKEEFFHAISGRLRITSHAGDAREFGPGDACVIPAGFEGVFEVLEPVRKHFVVIDRNAG
ncbi:cupin domain-containing protein [Cupriavidus pauculus]|uniref:cupin domain-containing protein n=1 Tax=Cupriavidus pauculus TaxID=82633 RepID=UPI0030F87880